MSKIITPKFRASYVTLFTPRKANETAEPKYSIVALFEKEPEVPAGSATLAAMQKLVIETAVEKFGSKLGGVEGVKKAFASGKLKSPFRKNDEGKYPDEYPVFITFSTSEKYPPGVVDRYKGPDGKPRVITDPDDVYSGCYARAEVKAFAYDTAGNRGVSFGLNNVQKLGEGDRLDSRTRATDAFGAFEDDAADFGEMGSGVDAGGDDPLGLDDA